MLIPNTTIWEILAQSNHFFHKAKVNKNAFLEVHSAGALTFIMRQFIYINLYQSCDFQRDIVDAMKIQKGTGPGCLNKFIGHFLRYPWAFTLK